MLFQYENISRELLVLIKWSQITELRLWEGLVLISERPWYEWLSQDLGITLSPYLSLWPRPGHGDYRDYLQSWVSWLQSPNPPDHYRTIGLAYRAQIRDTWGSWRIGRVMLQMISLYNVHSFVIELKITSIWYLSLIQICCGAAHVLFASFALIKAAKGERVIISTLLFTIPRYLFLKYAGRPGSDVR